MRVLYASGHQDWGGLYDYLVPRLEGHDLICAGHRKMRQYPDVDVVIPTTAELDEAALDRMPNLVLIQQAGSGVDRIDVRASLARGIQIGNVPTWASGAAHCVAEHALALLRQLPQHSRRPLLTPPPRSIRGLRAAIVGFGAIGTRLAELLIPFAVPVVGVVEHERPREWPDNVSEVVVVDRLTPVISNSDLLFVRAHRSERNYHLFDLPKIRICPPGTIFVNVARGELVDSAALLAALEEGILAGVGLDVLDGDGEHNRALTDHPAAIVTPHTAAVTPIVLQRTADIIAESVLRVSMACRLCTLLEICND